MSDQMVVFSKDEAERATRLHKAAVALKARGEMIWFTRGKVLAGTLEGRLRPRGRR